MITPAQYKKNKEEIRSVISAVLDNNLNCSADIEQELKKVNAFLGKSHFNILILSNCTQNGTSTLFNTFCGGREISPQLMGIKTSATKISAVSLPESEDEYVDIFWKTDRELLLTMMGFIEGSFNNHPERRKLFYDPQTKDLAVTLQTPGIVDIARECVAKEWEIYEKNPGVYDSECEGKLDLLRIATLILRFFNNPELEKYRLKDKVAVNELKSMVTFPLDWGARLEQKQNAEFKLDEILFVFMEGKYIVHIHNGALADLNCSVTELPQFLCNPYNFEVAHTTMRNADAILYLIGGQTAIRERDLLFLDKIVKNNLEHKRAQK